MFICSSSIYASVLIFRMMFLTCFIIFSGNFMKFWRKLSFLWKEKGPCKKFNIKNIIYLNIFIIIKKKKKIMNFTQQIVWMWILMIKCRSLSYRLIENPSYNLSLSYCLLKCTFIKKCLLKTKGGRGEILLILYSKIKAKIYPI